MTRRFRVAVDTGGTFTDFVLLDEVTREVSIAKVLSSPDDPSVSVMRGIEQFLAAEPAAEISYFCHGTTVGTNALLEEKGVRTGLLVTAGFRGIYEIMEQARPHGPALFDLEYDKPALLTPESRTGEVVERLDHLGRVLVPLDEDALRRTLRELRAGRFLRAIGHQNRFNGIFRYDVPVSSGGGNAPARMFT